MSVKLLIIMDFQGGYGSLGFGSTWFG